jgi:hydrogenase-4 component A
MRDAASSAPLLCRHCEEAPCANVCPVQAIKHQDNAIMLNESLCIGCKLCVIACPFGAITPSGSTPVAAPNSYPRFSQADAYAREARTALDNSDLDPMLAWAVGVRQVAVKCDLCSFLPTGPACVNACPNQTLFLVDERAIAQSGAAKRLAMLEALYDTNLFGLESTEQHTERK